MKRFLVVLSLGISLLTSGLTVEARAAETLKIGTVDLFRALNESEPGKRAKGDLESLVKSKQTSIDEKGKVIEKLKADMEKQASILSAEARKTKEEELERLLRDYQRAVTDSQTELKKKEGELTGSIIKELRETINRIGHEDAYSLILETAEGVVLFSDKSIDLTDRVIKRYNESKAKAGR